MDELTDYSFVSILFVGCWFLPAKLASFIFVCISQHYTNDGNL